MRNFDTTCLQIDLLIIIRKSLVYVRSRVAYPIKQFTGKTKTEIEKQLNKKDTPTFSATLNNSTVVLSPSINYIKSETDLLPEIL